MSTGAYDHRLNNLSICITAELKFIILRGWSAKEVFASVATAVI